jgi:hypothetical protein
MAKIGDREVATNDLGLMGAGIAVFIFSFLPWFGVSGYDASGNAWNVGFLAWFSVLLGMAAAIFIAVRVFSTVQLPVLGVGYSVIVLGATALATVLVLLKLLIGYKVSAGPFHLSLDRKVGLYLGLIAAAVQTYFAFAAFKLSGEKLPGGRTV